MATSKTTYIWCDICGNWIDGLSSKTQTARKNAKLKGWKYIKRQDICPCCLEIDEENQNRN